MSYLLKFSLSPLMWDFHSLGNNPTALWLLPQLTPTHMRACMHTHTHARTYMHTHAHAHACTYTHTHMRAYTHIHTHVHTHIHVHSHMHTHALTYTHACTHACMRAHTHTTGHQDTCLSPTSLPAHFLPMSLCGFSSKLLALTSLSQGSFDVCGPSGYDDSS